MSTQRTSRTWRTSRTLVLAALPLWCTVAVLVFNTPWWTKLLVGSVLVISIAWPAVGLLAVAALTPFGHFIAAALHLEPFHLSESIVLAFVAGWLVRPATRRAGPRTPTAAWILGAVVAVSIVAQAVRAASRPGELAQTLQILFQAYYLLPDGIGLQAGARVLEGVALVAATIALFREKPRLAAIVPIAIVAASTVAAAASFLVTRGIAPAQILTEHALNAPRTSAHVGDVNAAASYFGMTLFVALGMAARTRLIAGMSWLAAAAAQAWALWMTGSRSGEAAAAIVLGVAVVFALSARFRPRARALVLCAALGAALAAGAVRARMLQNDPGTVYRRDFTATSLRMMAARPVSGVGIGQYYDASSLFLSPLLGWTYGFENAHNYFLQLAAEIGAVGLAAFIALVLTVLFRATRHYLRAPDDSRLLGCSSGVLHLLATCLTSHPLLTDEVAYTFWILLGLIAFLGDSVAMESRDESIAFDRRYSPDRTAMAWTAGSAALAIAFVALGRTPLAPPESQTVTGLFPWESDADGSRYRWTHEYASLFVPIRATRVDIPLRQPANAPGIGPLGVSVRTAGYDKGRTMVGASWLILNIELPPIHTQQMYRRIDLKVDRTWQPAIYVPGSSDLRTLGVQVGEVRALY